MIAQLRGSILHRQIQKDNDKLLIDVNGVGYEVVVGLNALSRLPTEGQVILSVFQSITAYDGSSVLYGFPSTEEREIFVQLKEHVPGIGPKKALESLDRITKSLPDFKRAVIEKDIKLLVGVFGFSRKTAETLIYSLKDRVETLVANGPEKWAKATSSIQQEAVSALVTLGYAVRDAREAVEFLENNAPATSVEELLRQALKQLGSLRTLKNS